MTLRFIVIAVFMLSICGLLSRALIEAFIGAFDCPGLNLIMAPIQILDLIA